MNIIKQRAREGDRERYDWLGKAEETGKNVGNQSSDNVSLKNKKDTDLDFIVV
jgi:hypothetical protein